MNPSQLESLLYEDESASLDFKRQQYPFSGATEEQKTELLKDILGMANSHRRTDGYIIVGVEEVQGGRSIVHGVTEHLADHSLQQFVNDKLARPLIFGYETCEIDGKQVGIIRIELQDRPFYLKTRFGRLQPNCVYIRRGSSTNIDSPASPDEIKNMGAPVTRAQEPVLSVQWASEDETLLGSNFQWRSEIVIPPVVHEIPDYSGGMRTEFDRRFGFQGLLRGISNDGYYRQYATYFVRKSMTKVLRIAVVNSSESQASEVRVEFSIPTSSPIAIDNSHDRSERPKKRDEITTPAYTRLLGISSKSMRISTHCNRTTVEIDYPNIQPGRKLFTKALPIVLSESGRHELQGEVFAANLRSPLPFALAFEANVLRRELSVDELIALADEDDSNER